MTRDILDILKVKEGEMEALIEGARLEALEMKEAANVKAAALKVEKELAISEELEQVETEALKAIADEVSGVTGEAESEASGLRERAEVKRRQAIDGIAEILLEG